MRVVIADLPIFTAWIEELIAAQPVMGVQARDERFVFAPLHQAADLRLDYDVTILPPKKYFQPAWEKLSSFTGPAEFQTQSSTEPFIILGVHPYDVVAIAQMDTIFARDKFDAHYMARRQRATIIACDVQSVSDNVFAACMGTATTERGFDILLTRIGERYVVDARTARGESLLGVLAQAPAADAVSLGRRQQVWDDNRQHLCRHSLRMPPQALPELLAASYEHPVWEEKAQRCFSCGSCNLVCPTCYCFDVQDEVDWDLRQGRRWRTWDGCLLKDFAAVAGGHNFRKSRADRYRHRFYRKGKYVPDKIGEIACVGCGRCITACVTKIASPVEIYNRLLEAK